MLMKVNGSGSRPKPLKWVSDPTLTYLCEAGAVHPLQMRTKYIFMRLKSAGQDAIFDLPRSNNLTINSFI